MVRWLGWIGATLVGALGGWLGSHWGIFGGFCLGIVGTGLGLYYGRRIGADYQ